MGEDNFGYKKVTRDEIEIQRIISKGALGIEERNVCVLYRLAEAIWQNQILEYCGGR